jgi:quinoprotein dehydrogenase-associated probable ABC transporter substrate-binding protein
MPMRKARFLYLCLLFSSVVHPARATDEARREARSRVLRVCADPANLPYSNDREQGFENEIARFLARELHASLSYTWWAQRRGFLRNTLNAGLCDVVIGVPLGLEQARVTEPYYRSSFALVTRRDRHLGDLRSLDDARLRELKIGVPLAGDDGANPAPAHALSRRGIVSNVTGFSLWGEYERKIPAAVEAVAQGTLDVALLWGPLAGAGAKKSPEPLTVRLLNEQQDAGIPLAFSMAMAVRENDAPLAAELNAVIRRRRPALQQILRSAGVPLLELEPKNREPHHARP